MTDARRKHLATASVASVIFFPHNIGLSRIAMHVDHETFTAVADAFSRQSKNFDAYEERNPILQWMRSVVHQHMLAFIRPGDRVLELNAGTGIDAVFFAQHGVHVLATDIASGMIEQLREKAAHSGFEEYITTEQRSFTDLEELPSRSFDHIFSNFGGLNCAEDPGVVIRQFQLLLKPGGTATLVVMPPVCPWEIAVMFNGNFRLALRRMKRNGASAYIEGVYFTSYYFTPARLIKMFGKKYRLLSLRGLGSFVPPPCFERFPRRFPTMFDILKKLEQRFSYRIPFNRWADHVILTMRYEP
ncbi:MAG: methyltransferase domain-containing protein [Bacteroidota bacterium]|nr:methyltransferase domain-containing protein [Bacteroidota bacterium]